LGERQAAMPIAADTEEIAGTIVEPDLLICLKEIRHV
jgi:hypothetical protein